MNRKISLLGAIVGSMILSAAAQAVVLYNNPWDGGVLGGFSSQNDTTGGNGNFASSFGYFDTGGQTWDITDIHWKGVYFNPPAPGVITGWTVVFHQDVAGAPGAPAPGGTFPGLLPVVDVVETPGPIVGGFPYATYDLATLPSTFTFNGTGWLRIVPDMGFPPQWGWASGIDANPAHFGWQDFFGARSRLPGSLSFSLTGDVPEPTTLSVLGLCGMAILGRRRA